MAKLYTKDAKDQRISCSKESNSGAEKNSPKDISKPSQSFFIVIIETSLRRSSIKLYAVEGVTPARFASSLILIPRFAQIP